MRSRIAVSVVVAGSLLLPLTSVAVAQDPSPPTALAAHPSEVVVPGVWRIIGDRDDDLLGSIREVSVGPDGSVWLLSTDGAFPLAGGIPGPPRPPVDRLLGVGANGEAWLRYVAVDRQGIGTWDGQTWMDVTPERRASALVPDSAGSPGVIRDLALGPDGSIWVVAGEQDSPRWERFTVERLDEDGWTSWAIGDGLPELTCGKNCGDGSRVIAMDDGVVWVSVDQGGLLRFDGRDWEAVRPLGGDVDRPILSLVGDPGGVLWVDVQTGPGERVRARFDRRAWSVPAHAQPPSGVSTDRGVAVAPDGTLWAVESGSSGRALVAMAESERRRVTKLTSCPVEEPNAFDRGCTESSAAIGPDGLLWLIVDGGVPQAERGAGLLVVDPVSALKD